MTEYVIGGAVVVFAGALLEWRLHRNRVALRSWESVEHQKVIDTLTATIRSAMKEAIAEAMALERDNGKAIDALSEHVELLDDEMGEVKKLLGLTRRERAARAIAALEGGVPPVTGG